MHIDILDCVGGEGEGEGEQKSKVRQHPHRHRYHIRGGDIVTVS